MGNTVEPPQKRPFTAWVLILLVFILGIMAVISGAMLFLAPDGRLMMWTTEQLEGTPFPDYLIPGIVLFIFNGVFPLIVGAGLVKTRWKGLEPLNPFKHHHWAWTGSLAAGIILLIWISTETLMLGYTSFLQPLMAAWGVLLIFLVLLPGTRRYYRLN
jgi:hypothetical protein